MNRRNFFSGAATAVAAASVSRVALAALPEPVMQTSADTAPPLQPPTGRPYNPVVTLNGWTAPWRMNAGVKEFHLVAEPVVREVAPGFLVNMWGYNGQSPGPTIEVVEGDRVRIFVTNRLPEHTTIHWHGQRLPNGMDGVGGLNQPAIPPGKTFVYEFEARRPGTFMYHPHADEMVQMAMGMMGLWITHPKAQAPAHRQGAARLRLPAQRLRRGARQHDPQGQHHAGPQHLVPGTAAYSPPSAHWWPARASGCASGWATCTMTNHPIHIHGTSSEVTGTDGGPVPKSARWPEVTTDVAVGQMRQIELIADEPGDWALHCHKSHHTMGAMGHAVPTMIGVDHRGLVGKIQKIVPDYMVMGERGMADMGAMEMPLPDNTFPDDDRHRPLWPAGDGRHVHHPQGARQPAGGRLPPTPATTPSPRAPRPTNGKAPPPTPHAPRVPTCPECPARPPPASPLPAATNIDDQSPWKLSN